MTAIAITPEITAKLAKHEYMSVAQAKWIFELINTRVTEAELAAYKVKYFEVKDRESFEKLLKDLRERPVVEGKVPALATEPGLYRDPSDGSLYRITKKGWDLHVGLYSNKAGSRRRLTLDGEIVKLPKGTWKRYNAWDSKAFLHPKIYTSHVKILAEWAMSDQDKIDYQYGICMFCMRGLRDGRSVIKNYGPDCAKDHGLPWGDK